MESADVSSVTTSMNRMFNAASQFNSDLAMWRRWKSCFMGPLLIGRHWK